MCYQTYLTLPNGQKMPSLGLGSWEANDHKELEVAVNLALELGYRHIDTAFLYQNEAAIGRVLEQWLSSGKIKREELFITTKLPAIGVHPDRVEYFMKKSLENLQLDYVDLYLIHFPVGLKFKEGMVRGYKNEDGTLATEGKTDHAAVWKKMEEQVDAGRAKNIGLSNYNISQIQTVLNSARIKPASLQVELHLYLQQRELVEFCRKNGITVVAFCPLGSPNFNKFMERMGQNPIALPNILGNSAVLQLAEKYKKTPAQIALKYLLQLGISAIPKSVNAKRLKENFDLFDFTISVEDMKTLSGLEQGETSRIADFRLYHGVEKHPDFPLKQEK